MFPNHFYLDQSSPKFVYTAEVTGILPDPMQLFTSSRPWLTIEPGEKTQTTQKKILVFADHLHCYRSANAQKKILTRLLHAYAEEFKLQIVSAEGKIIPIEKPADFPKRSYSLPLRQFTYEVINALACQYNSVPANHLVILDYFGINELLGENRYRIEALSFKISEDIFFDLLKQVPLFSALIAVDTQPKFKQFLALNSQQLALHSNKIAGLTTPSPTPNLNQYQELFKILPQLRSLEFNRYSRLMELHQLSATIFHQCEELWLSLDYAPIDAAIFFNAFPNLKYLQLFSRIGTQDKYLFNYLTPGQLPLIARLELNLHSVAPTELLALLKAMPNLTALDIEESSEIADSNPSDLPKGYFKFLEKLKIDCVDSDSIQGLLNAAPLLTALTVDLPQTNNAEELNCFEKLDTNQLPYLKEIYIGENCGMSSPARIAHIFRVAPNLTVFSAPDTKDTAKYFTSCQPSQLKFLKEVNLGHHAIAEEDLLAILNHSPLIEELAFNYLFEINSILLSLRPNQLKYLKKIGLFPDEFSAKTLLLFSRVAPQLSHIEIAEVDSGAIESLPAGSLLHIEFLNINHSIIPARQLQILLAAMPNIRILEIHSCSLGVDLDIQITLRLPKLISCNFNSENAKMLELIIHSAPLLANMEIAGCAIQSVFNTPHLLYLSVRSHSLGTFFLSHLITTAPQLRELHIIDQKPMGVEKSILLEYDAIQEIRKLIQENPHTFANKVEDYLQELSPKGLAPDAASEKICTLDYFDTSDDSIPLDYITYFQNIPPEQYRIQLLQPDLNTLKLYHPLKAEKYYNPVTLESIDTIDLDLFDLHQGVFNTKYSHGKTITLVSLQYAEKLVSVKIINAARKAVPLGLCTIKRGKYRKLFQITLPHPGSYTIYYTLATRKAALQLPEALTQLANKYRQYGTLLQPKHPFKNLQEAAAYINAQKSGVCAHRALAAYAELKNTYQDNVWIVENDLHSFIEVIENGVCYTVDLGGGDGPIQEHSLQNLEEEPDDHPIESAVMHAHTTHLQYLPFDATETIFQENYNALIISHSDAGHKTYLNYLLKQYSGNADFIFMARRPEELNSTGNGFNSHGEIVPDHTPLNLWLQNRMHGSIVIDVREFTASELAQINDLLDRHLPNHIVPATISIILLDSSQRSGYGPDLRRRVPIQRLLPDENENLFSAQLPEVRDEVMEMNLFHSPFWQCAVIGNWQLVKKAASERLYFQWQRSPLVNLLLDPNQAIRHIHFKNPPLTDLQFISFMTELQSLKRIKWVDQAVYYAADIQYSQSSGYAWENLARHTSLVSLADMEEDVPYVLSDTNLAMFIQPNCYEYSATATLIANDSYLQRCIDQGYINIICAPGLTDNGLAQFLTHVQHLNASHSFEVRFTAPNFNTLDSASPLFHLNLLANKADNPPGPTPVKTTWELHDDVYYATRRLLHAHPEYNCFDLTSLEASELGRYPQSIDITKQSMLHDHSFFMQAQLSDILKKLQAGETVLLSGSIAPALYLPLTDLTLGLIERKFYPGQLIIYTPPEEQDLAEALIGKHLAVQRASLADKLQLLASLHPDCPVTENLSFASFAIMERHVLNAKAHRLLPARSENQMNEEACADEIDRLRLQAIRTMLAVFPWAGISGVTGTGKTYFLQHLLPQNRVFSHVEEWLHHSPTHAEDIYWVLDDPDFSTLPHQQTNHFLDRLITLLYPNRIFLYKGVLYPITRQHKFIVVLDHVTPLEKQKNSMLSSQHILTKEFKTLPLYYLNLRLIKPLLQRFLRNNQSVWQHFSFPILKVSAWILNHTVHPAVFLTGNEIKAMVYFIIDKISSYGLSAPDHVYQAAKEFARKIGRQTLTDHPVLLAQFDQAFPALPSVFKRSPAPAFCLEQQIETYWFIQDLLAVKSLLSRYGITDLGLGGMILEGASNIGKSYFINHIKREYAEKTRQNTLQISASASPFEKENQLTQAAAVGTFVVSHEYNTGIWPNNFLRFFLLGTNKSGQPLVKSSVFFATQNSKAFNGRADEDQTIRRRLIKLHLDWKVYQPAPAANIASSSSSSFFNNSPHDARHKRKWDTLDNTTNEEKKSAFF